VHTDVSTLLEVQAEDLVIYELEDRLTTMAPRLAALEQERERAVAALAQAEAVVAEEERRGRDLAGQVEQYRALVDRNRRALDSVTSPREAAAASSQLEQASRMIADVEYEARTTQARLDAARHAVAECERALGEREEEQRATREALAAERGAIEAELETVRGRRNARAAGVGRPLLQKYDRVRSRRRSLALFPLRDGACAACDTAIPLHRRSQMARTGQADLCEGCGVLLYAAEEAVHAAE